MFQHNLNNQRPLRSSNANRRRYPNFIFNGSRILALFCLSLFLISCLDPIAYKETPSATPTSIHFSPRDVGSDDTIDSDVDSTTGQEGFVNDSANIDTGFVYQTDCSGDDCRITGIAWDDIDSDGIRTSGEHGIPNVAVHLQDSFGNIFATTKTDDDGVYEFIDLNPDSTYIIRFELDSFFLFSPQNVGQDDTIDSDVDPTTGEKTVINLPAIIDAGLLSSNPPDDTDFVSDDPPAPDIPLAAPKNSSGGGGGGCC